MSIPKSALFWSRNTSLHVQKPLALRSVLYAIKLIMFLLLSKFGNNCGPQKGSEVFCDLLLGAD